MNASLHAAAALSRAWVKLYTARLPDVLRDSRRAEMDADLWEHQADRLASRNPTGIIAAEILLRTCLGVLDDVAWRFDVLRAMRSGSTKGRFPVLQMNSRQTRWLGLAGLAGGLLWAVNVLALVQQSRADGPGHYPVLRVLSAVLLLAGLAGFLTSYREELGRKGRIGVVLLVVSQASFFLANTLLPAVRAPEPFYVVTGAGFALLPIPGFILIGLALKGLARAGAILIAIAGPLCLFLPSILARFGVVDPGWLRTESPVSLTYGIYFILAAAWLAAAGFSTFRHAQQAA